MGSDEHSRCILHNFFLREVRFRQLGIDVFLEFFNRLGSMIQKKGYTDEPKSLVVEVCDAEPRLLFKGPAVLSEDIQVSRVMFAGNIVKYQGGVLGAAYDRDRTEQRICAEIETRRLRAEHLIGSSWSGNRGICWVTQTESIENLRTSVPASELATRVRNALGIRGEEDKYVHVVEIIYPQDFLNTNHVFVPTVLEGGECVYFRPHRETNGWGRTVDQQTLGAGLPEAVHAKMPVSADFQLRYLGKVNGVSPGFKFKALLIKSKELM